MAPILEGLQSELVGDWAAWLGLDFQLPGPVDGDVGPNWFCDTGAGRPAMCCDLARESLWPVREKLLCVVLGLIEGLRLKAPEAVVLAAKAKSRPEAVVLAVEAKSRALGEPENWLLKLWTVDLPFGVGEETRTVDAPEFPRTSSGIPGRVGAGVPGEGTSCTEILPPHW